jgi:hypothetical protein
MWHARMTEVLTFNMYTLYVLVLERSVFGGDPSSASRVLVLAGCTPYCGEKKKVDKEFYIVNH